jgi:hypothetical protein
MPAKAGGHVPVVHAVVGVGKPPPDMLIPVTQQICPPVQSIMLVQLGAAASGWPVPLLLPLAPPLSSALPLLELPLPVLPLPLPLLLPLLPPGLLLLEPQAIAVARAHDAANKIIPFFM